MAVPSARSLVRRRRRIKSYAGFTTGAAKFTIEPLTRNCYEYAQAICPEEDGDLKSAMSWDVRGTAGAIKFGAGGRHWHLVEYGTTSRTHVSGKYVGVMPAQPFLRRAVAKAKREMRSHWRNGIKEAEREQRV